MADSRTFGYARASRDRMAEAVPAQVSAIQAYCEHRVRPLDRLFVDRAEFGSKRLFDRDGGRKLILALRRGDHLVLAGLDKLDDSALKIGETADWLRKLGVVTHVLDPGCILDPADPGSNRFVKTLINVAEHERRTGCVKTAQGLALLKAEGKRYCGFAPIGFRWERRGHTTFMLPDDGERAICIRVAELRAEGYSIDQVRQAFAHHKVRNRRGNEFGNTEIWKMSRRGAQWLGAEASEDAEHVPESTEQRLQAV